jgi:excisionase family DNA binding protein
MENQNYETIPEMITLQEASKRTGLSYEFLRKSCINGRIVHIRVGNGKYLINFGCLIDWLNTSYGN